MILTARGMLFSPGAPEHCSGAGLWVGAAEKVQAEAAPAREWEALAGPLLSAAQASPLILPFCRSGDLLWPLAKGNPKVLAWGLGPPFLWPKISPPVPPTPR